MIAKGTTHNSGARLAAYLVTSKDNERAELFELRGFAEADAIDAFRSVHVMADATRCEKPFYHLQVRTPEGEELTREQWLAVAERMEDALGLTDQPRAVAFHIKDGHEHMHIGWSRIDEETMTAKELKFDHERLRETCRELEIEMGLTRVRNERGPDELPMPGRGEFEEARRLGIDLRLVRQDIRDCWETSDGSQAFAAALTDHDLMLARGDRRDFVVIDPEGGVHALGKRLLGCPMAEIRERLADLENLPSIAEAREGLDQHIFQRHPPASPLEVPEHVPTENLGPVPGADRFKPNVREPQVFGEEPGAPVIGAAVVSTVSAIADAAASGAEKGFDLVADVFSFGAAGSSKPAPAPVEPAVPEKPRHDPHEDAAHMLHTADRGIAQDDPATLAAFATNPAAAAPDLAQQLRDRWRRERERDRDIER